MDHTYSDSRYEQSEAKRLKSESRGGSPRPSGSDRTPDNASSTSPVRKKGVAMVVKKAPKRPMAGGPKAAKKFRSQRDGSSPEESEGGSEGGPYCLCRGSDDHRWMICCEFCDDWFHGECIKMTKEVGENLIEKFVCPNCTDSKVFTIYKKSAFCSAEHSQMWWDRIISRLPKGKSKSGLNDQLSQDEIMAILASDLSEVSAEGKWGIKADPFGLSTEVNGAKDEAMPDQITDEERIFVDMASSKKKQLEDEIAMCNKMLTLIELAQDRRRAAIAAGKIGEDICGYDQRLDAVSARDVFSAYVASPEGQLAFEQSQLVDPLGENSFTRGMCERKRCKPHSGWQKLLAAGIKHQIREMTEQAEEVGEEERAVRDAAGERLRRRMAEGNRVEIL